MGISVRWDSHRPQGLRPTKSGPPPGVGRVTLDAGPIDSLRQGSCCISSPDLGESSASPTSRMRHLTPKTFNSEANVTNDLEPSGWSQVHLTTSYPTASWRPLVPVVLSGDPIGANGRRSRWASPSRYRVDLPGTHDPSPRTSRPQRSAARGGGRFNPQALSDNPNRLPGPVRPAGRGHRRGNRCSRSPCLRRGRHARSRPDPR